MAFEPAQLTLRYQIDVSELSTSAQDSLYIDLARDLSAVNRRLYRQGMTYFIQGMSVVAHSDDPDSAVFRVGTAPNTWCVHNAWTKGFALWKDQNNRVLKKHPSLKPMFHDFKVFIDPAMTADLVEQVGTNYVHADCDLLNPVDIDDNMIVPGEWLYSQFEFEEDIINGSSFSGDTYVTIIGEDSLSTTHKSVSLLDGYMSSRARLGSSNPPTEGSVTSSSWMLSTDVGSEDELDEIATNLDVTNDAPPYFLTHPAGLGPTSGGNSNRTHGVGTLAVGDANGSTDKMSGFAAPCGLIEIQYEDLGGNDSEDYFLYVTLMPGNYRGVAAVPMGQ